MNDYATRLFQRTPVSDEAKEAIQNTDGAELLPDGLKLTLLRYQKPEQAGEESVRTGVFYMVGNKSPYERYFKQGRAGKTSSGYGGTERVVGTTVYCRPLIIKGSAGGGVPKRALDLIRGKGFYDKMRSQTLEALYQIRPIWGKPPSDPIRLTEGLIKHWGGDPSTAYLILDHSREGNQLAYAIQENIVAKNVRDAGYDSIIGYAMFKGKPVLSEVFDLRARTYPEGNAWNHLYTEFYDDLQEREERGDIVLHEPKTTYTVTAKRSRRAALPGIGEAR